MYIGDIYNYILNRKSRIVCIINKYNKIIVINKNKHDHLKIHLKINGDISVANIDNGGHCWPQSQEPSQPSMSRVTQPETDPSDEEQ